MRRALVTGGTGFIGSHLLNHLIAHGWEVHVLCRNTPASHPDVHQHCIPDNLTELTPLLCRIQADIVFHLATHFIAEHRPEHIDPLIATNLQFGTHLLEAMATSETRQLVNTGTSWQHLQAESPDYHPANLYAATKQAFEAVIDYYCEAHGLAALTLHLYDSYGPGDTRPKLLNQLLRRDVASPPLALSPGAQTLCLVHVQDIVEALLHSAMLLPRQTSSSHIRYRLGGLTPLPLHQIVSLLESLAGKHFNVAWGEKPYRAREIMAPWTLGTPLPGWAPKIALEAGLRDLLQAAAPSP